MERKIYEAQFKQVTDAGKGTAILARLGVVDKDGDILEPGLLGGEPQTVPLVQSHDWQVPSFGRAVVRERAGELVTDIELNTRTARGREWHEVLKFDLERGPIQEWSFGFSIEPNGSEVRTLEDGRRVRSLRKIRLHEVSPVVRGASIGSRTVALKQDVASETAAVVEGYERLRVKMVVQEFERSRERAELSAERPHGYVFLLKGTRPHIERAAVRFAGWASEELGISPPEVRLFLAAGAGESPNFRMTFKVVGVTLPIHTIAVDGSLGAEALAETVAHECMHLKQGSEPDEPAADAFARKFMATTYREKIGGSASRPGVGLTAEQLGHIGRALKSGLPIPR